ncbi:MAG TPA: lysophospholipid acyltransferase family protein [Candidatus Dormibacteraeota bacterium]|nr:lysophospholipid acyltransferase family protein [Candidatus Dormibacteraeota bacterium]
MQLSTGPSRGLKPGSERTSGTGLPSTPGARLDGTQSGLLTLTRAVLRLTVRVVARGGLQLGGLSQVPNQGPLLICSNHVSNFDPLVYAAILPRVIHALTKAELYANPVMRAFLLRCNCIPVRRGSPDRLAVRGALAVLRSGGALLLFPEGHRAPAQGMLEFEAGAGYLALKSGAEVLPCAIWGTEHVLPKGRLVPRRAAISVRLGEPFRPLGDDPVAISKEIQSRVAELLPPRYRPSADSD